MDADLSVKNILLQIKQLDKQDKLLLFNKLKIIVGKSGRKKGVKLSSITGLGSAMWNKINIDEYFYQERQW